jgi:hypothetical protein
VVVLPHLVVYAFIPLQCWSLSSSAGSGTVLSLTPTLLHTPFFFSILLATLPHNEVTPDFVFSLALDAAAIVLDEILCFASSSFAVTTAALAATVVFSTATLAILLVL